MWYTRAVNSGIEQDTLKYPYDPARSWEPQSLTYISPILGAIEVKSWEELQHLKLLEKIYKQLGRLRILGGFNGFMDTIEPRIRAGKLDEIKKSEWALLNIYISKVLFTPDPDVPSVVTSSGGVSVIVNVGTEQIESEEAHRAAARELLDRFKANDKYGPDRQLIEGKVVRET